jgi:putative DNA primase/helicase
MLLGSENKSSVPLQKLLKERFASILIFRKLANIYADLREDIVENLGEFKAYTGEDTVVIEDKFKRPFNWRPYVKHIFSKNDPPNIRVDEADDAFWNRWIIVEFIGNFTKKIYKFEETLADEIPNVIPIAIACFLVVKRRGLQFSYASTIEEVKNIWLSRINTIYGFINWVKKNKLLRPATGMPTFTDVIYNIYTRWCEANDKMPETQANFTKELKRMGFAVVRDRSGRSKVKNYILDADAAEKLVNAVLGEESTENTQGQSLFRETLM